MTDASPTRSFEVELKYDVDVDTPLPALASLPGVAHVTDADVRPLDARYLDTADLALARAGYAVRRRTGGPDAGWHIKGPKVDGARIELQWELGESDAAPPALLAEMAAAIGLTSLVDADLTPVARIVNERTAYHLLDAAGGVIAEFVDDHVVATDVRARVERAWREWELELGSAAPADPVAFFEAATAAALAAGARPAASASKLARALGH